MSAERRCVVVSERVRLGPGPSGWSPAAVVCEGTTIAEVVALAATARARADAVAAYAAAGAAVYDVGARPVSPAFVNAHTHLALAFLRGPELEAAARDDVVESLFFGAEARLEAADVRAFARMGAYESLLGGVGLVWDHYYFASAVADALADVGLAGVVAPTLQDLAGPGRGAHEAALAETEALATDPARAARGIFAAVGPHATDTASGPLWRAAVDLARRLALPVHAHLAQSPAEVARVRAREGVEPLPWLERLGVLADAPSLVLAHALYVRGPQLAALDPARHAIAYCPSAQAVFGFPAAVRAFARLGAPWVVATDSAAGNDAMALQRELRIAAAARTADLTGGALFAAHFDGDTAGSEAALGRARDARMAEAAFAAPASLLDRVLGRPGALHPRLRAGVIAPGALASLVVWDETHPALWPARDLDRALAYADAAAAIHALFVAGRPVGTPGDFARSLLESDGYREAHREATARLRRFFPG